jgi:hypothetical protein
MVPEVLAILLHIATLYMVGHLFYCVFGAPSGVPEGVPEALLCRDPAPGRHRGGMLPLDPSPLPPRNRVDPLLRPRVDLSHPRGEALAVAEINLFERWFQTHVQTPNQRWQWLDDRGEVSPEMDRYLRERIRDMPPESHRHLLHLFSAHYLMAHRDAPQGSQWRNACRQYCTIVVSIPPAD